MATQTRGARLHATYEYHRHTHGLYRDEPGEVVPRLPERTPPDDYFPTRAPGLLSDEPAPTALVLGCSLGLALLAVVGAVTVGGWLVRMVGG